MSGDPDESEAFATRLEAVRDAVRREVDERLRPWQPVSDGVLLAALDRAERHWPHYEQGARGAAMSAIKEHLAFANTGATTLKLRPQLDALIADGCLKATRRHSVRLWELTEKGQRQLARARRSGDIALPEAPQHHQWRQAREQASALFTESRPTLRTRLTEAVALLDADHARADDWLDMQKRIDRECRRLASAIFCLREWPEPDDAQLDAKRRWDLSDSAVLRSHDY